MLINVFFLFFHKNPVWLVCYAHIFHGDNINVVLENMTYSMSLSQSCLFISMQSLHYPLNFLNYLLVHVYYTYL